MMRTSDELLERVFDALEDAEADGSEVVSIKGLRKRIGSRDEFHARELVRDLAASEVGS